jgi:diacylglycerol kinase (ATP)
MQDKKSLKYLFVVNPGSGRNTGDSWTDVINNFLKDSGSLYDIYVLPGKIDVQQVKTNVLNRGPEHVIAVGGDGTVTMLANILAGSEIPLGILPGGSANGMAKELGIPENATEALEIIKAGFVKDFDLIKINDKDYCLHLSDLGLNAQLIRYFDKGKLRGKLGYGRVVIKTLMNKRKMNVLIRTKDTAIQRTAFMVALANARTYGTGAVINPEGKTNDGLFEVIIVKKLRFGALLKMLFKPGLFNPKNIEIIPCTSVEINTPRRMHFQIDGEYAGREKNVTAIIQPGAVKMILPAS